MANPLDDAIEALRVEVENNIGVGASAIAFIQGVPGLIQVAVDAAIAAGSTPAQLSAVTDMQAKVAAESQAFVDALTVNPDPAV